MKKWTVRQLVEQGMLAAAYAALTLLLAPFSFGVVQLRVSEALAVLPFLHPACTVGLTLGCLAANLLGSGLGILDIVFGSLATLLAGLGSAHMPKDWLAPLPPIIANGVIVGAVLALSSPGVFWNIFPAYGLQVAAGELLACYGLGYPLLRLLRRYGNDRFGRLFAWRKR